MKMCSPNFQCTSIKNRGQIGLSQIDNPDEYLRIFQQKKYTIIYMPYHGRRQRRRILRGRRNVQPRNQRQNLNIPPSSPSYLKKLYKKIKKKIKKIKKKIIKIFTITRTTQVVSATEDTIIL